MILGFSWSFLIQCLMVDFVVPVLADNPLAYCPVLILLYGLKPSPMQLKGRDEFQEVRYLLTA